MHFQRFTATYSYTSFSRFELISNFASKKGRSNHFLSSSKCSWTDLKKSCFFIDLSKLCICIIYLNPLRFNLHSVLTAYFFYKLTLVKDERCKGWKAFHLLGPIPKMQDLISEGNEKVTSKQIDLDLVMVFLSVQCLSSMSIMANI